VTENKRIVWLILIMMAAVSVSTAVAIIVLYRTAFEQERLHLIQIVDDQAHLMDAVARSDQEQYGSGDLEASEAATFSQIQDAFDHYPSYGQIAEITVAHRQGANIVYLVTHGRAMAKQADPIPFASDLAEPMRRALSGQSGSMVGLDYRGVRVLAAYQPVPVLNAGVVAKIDLADIRAPFLRGAGMVIGLALMLVSVGTFLFVRLTNPIIKHLNETEQRYQHIFSGTSVAIWEQDLSGVSDALQDLRRSGLTELKPYLAGNPEALRHLMGKARIIEANAAALRTFGMESSPQFITWFERVVVPENPEVAADLLRALWKGDETLVHRTVSVKTRDGRDLAVLLSMVIPGAGSRYHSVPVSALDVTADLNLRQREDELSLILASTDQGVFGLDNELRCTFVNRAAVQMLGYQDEKELLGREMHPLIHHTCRDGSPLPLAECPIYQASRKNTVVRLEDEELWRADHTSFPAEYSLYPMVRDGEVVGRVATFTDITERKEREAQHVHAQKMEVVGQLTGGIAHDFNNLLAIVLVNLRMLAEQFQGESEKETRELVDDALSAAQDGADLTDRLLNFSRRQAGKPRLSDVNKLLGDFHKLLRRAAGDDIDLILRMTEGPLPVLVDPQQLENAILNLAINARNAMPAGGRLTIATARQHFDQGVPVSHGCLEAGSYAVVSVTDTGVGMSPETAQRATEPFYTTKMSGKGSGLGLSMVFRFAQQACGGLAIESTPDQGTSISLFLPEAISYETDGKDAQARQMPVDVLRKTATILVVEDEQRTRRMAKRILSDTGYHVLEAENAAAATAILLSDTRVDLLFSDVFMPGELDGRELGHWARQHHPGLKVLLTSGLLRQSPDEDDPNIESLPFLGKPYSKEQLQQAIQTVLSAQPS